MEFFYIALRSDCLIIQFQIYFFIFQHIDFLLLFGFASLLRVEVVVLF